MNSPPTMVSSSGELAATCSNSSAGPPMTQRAQLEGFGRRVRRFFSDRFISDAATGAAQSVRVPAVKGVARDLRLDLFRGLALWLIFLDHIPSNIVSWITIRNYRLLGRHRDLCLHFRLHGRLRLWPGDARAWNRGRERAHPQARVANLRRSHLPVRDLHGRNRLVSRSFENPLYGEEMEYFEFLSSLTPHARAGDAVEVQARQYGRAASLHRVAGGFSRRCCG